MPVHHRLGGFDTVLATLATFRVSVAGAAVGLAEAALREAVRHAAGREQFGVPLARLGAVPAAPRPGPTWRRPARSPTAPPRPPPGTPAGLCTSRRWPRSAPPRRRGRIVDRAVQVMGRFGLVRGSKK